MGRLRRNLNHEKKLFANNVYYVNNPLLHKGTWNKVFKNDNPIEIEIGTGKGKFILEKALKNPHINYIAIDKFATILYKLLNKLNKLDKILLNLKIIVVDVKKIDDVFEKGEVKKIYLNFPDPWPKKHHEKFRLTSNFFVDKFFQVCSGHIIFKTDNANLFNYTLNKIKENKHYINYVINDLHKSFLKENNIKTEYEQKWINKGVKIKKIKFKKQVGV